MEWLNLALRQHSISKVENFRHILFWVDAFEESMPRNRFDLVCLRRSLRIARASELRLVRRDFFNLEMIGRKVEVNSILRLSRNRMTFTNRDCQMESLNRIQRIRIAKDRHSGDLEISRIFKVRRVKAIRNSLLQTCALLVFNKSFVTTFTSGFMVLTLKKDRKRIEK